MATTKCTCQHPADRFWDYVKEVPSGCWEWQGHLNNTGYGKYRYEGKMRFAHRLAWEFDGACKIPDGLVLDHLCRNRACVNPDHLEPVTIAENSRRMHQSKKREVAA